ncbi:MAG TPA: helix-turn-helix domain-containing protein [Verrucomicrobiae bacterium]|nr:helix-turn-helix domain-containing protein [Verrucomicrobiae bacterium]
MKDRITLSLGDRRRALELNQVEAGVFRPEQAALRLGVGSRQLQRLRDRYRKEGAEALVHGYRGQRPVNAVDCGVARRVVERATGPYVGFNQQHLTGDAR